MGRADYPLKASIFPSVKWGWPCGLYSPGSVTWIRKWVLSSDDGSLEGGGEVSWAIPGSALGEERSQFSFNQSCSHGIIFFFFFYARGFHIRLTEWTNEKKKKISYLSQQDETYLLVPWRKCSVIQSCPILCNPMDCSPPGSSVHEILQARILEWVAIPFSMWCSRSRDWTLGLMHCS